MGFIKNKAYNYTRSQIEFAMRHSRSNAEAARFLGCHIDTYKKYASLYYDKETGKTLWEVHKNPTGKGIASNKSNLPFKKTDIFEILAGKHPTYNWDYLQARLLNEGIFDEECQLCGFHERRITDSCVPLIMIPKDGDKTNHKKENLEMLCYNCYFLTYDDMFADNTQRAKFFRGYK